LHVRSLKKRPKRPRGLGAVSGSCLVQRPTVDHLSFYERLYRDWYMRAYLVSECWLSSLHATTTFSSCA